MKKLISIMAAASMVASLSLTSFAATTTEVKIDETNKDNVTLTATDSGYTAGLAGTPTDTQYTIVVVKNDTAGNATITTNSIEYINQSTEQNFNFVLKSTPANGDKFTVFLGGDKTNKVTAGTIEAKEEEPVAPVGEHKITFLNADGTTYQTIATKDGAVVLPETDPTKAKSGNKQYGFVGWYMEEGLTTKIANAEITADTTVYPKFVQIGVYGDANADGMANGTDLVMMKQKVTKGDNYTGNVGNKEYVGCITSKNKTAVYGDADGNGSVNGTDLVLVKQKVTKGDNYTGTVGTLMTVVKD